MSEAERPRLLLVEDEPRSLDLGVEALKEARFAVPVTMTGSDARKALDEAGANDGAVIADIDFGPGAAGWKRATHARDLNSKMPIIDVSGGSSNDWTSKGVPHSTVRVKPLAFAAALHRGCHGLPAPRNTTPD
jgi:DNA-binding response OmpR family regulator